MPSNAIAQIDAPRQRRGAAKRVVLFAGQKTADAPDGDSNRDGNCKQISGAAPDSASPLHQLDRESAAEQRAHNGLAGKKISDICPPVQGLKWIFEPVENSGSGGSAYRGCDDHIPSGLAI